MLPDDGVFTLFLELLETLVRYRVEARFDVLPAPLAERPAVRLVMRSPVRDELRLAPLAARLDLSRVLRFAPLVERDEAPSPERLLERLEERVELPTDGLRDRLAPACLEEGALPGSPYDVERS